MYKKSCPSRNREIPKAFEAEHFGDILPVGYTISTDFRVALVPKIRKDSESSQSNDL